MPSKKPEPTAADLAGEELNEAQKRWLDAQRAAEDALRDLQDAERKLAEAQQQP